MARKAMKLQKVRFPIERDMVIWNSTYHEKINRGDMVKCVFCGEHFIINSKTAFMFDGMEFITCPECAGKADVCYYMGKVVKNAPKNYVEEEEEENEENK